MAGHGHPVRVDTGRDRTSGPDQGVRHKANVGRLVDDVRLVQVGPGQGLVGERELRGRDHVTVGGPCAQQGVIRPRTDLKAVGKHDQRPAPGRPW